MKNNTPPPHLNTNKYHKYQNFEYLNLLIFKYIYIWKQIVYKILFASSNCLSIFRIMTRMRCTGEMSARQKLTRSRSRTQLTRYLEGSVGSTQGGLKYRLTSYN